MTKLAVSIAEATEITGIGRSRLYEEIRAGKIQPRKNGTRTLLLVADLAAYVQSLPLANAKAA